MKKSIFLLVAFIATVLQLSAQEVVKGTVADSNGEPVVGASIFIEGTTKGAISDVDGTFSLAGVQKGTVLTVSCIGYKTVQEAYNGGLLNVVLEEDTRLLEETVVVGYGTQKKQNLTGATSTVKMDDVLGNRPVSSVSTALIGAVPGLRISSDTGSPGSSNSLSIRGVTSSINGGSPLVLVDNVEMSLDLLDPNDIETVSVLKDAAASAIYGARAAFGVILITTKKGAQDDTFRISFNANVALSTPMNVPEKATPLQTVQMYKNIGDYSGSQNLDKWLGLIESYNANPSAYPGGFVMGTEADGDAGIKYSLANNNMIKDMMATCGVQQIYNLSAAGGNKKMSYRMSAGIVDEDGILVMNKDTYKRYNVSAYIRSDAKSWIKPELDVKFTNSEIAMPTNGPSFGIWGSSVAFPSYYSLGSTQINGVEYDYNTPANLIKHSYPTRTERNNVRVSGRVTLIPLKGWDIVAEYTTNKDFSNKKAFNPIWTFARVQDETLEQSATPENSKYEVYNTNSTYNSLNIFSTYQLNLGSHNLKFMLGFNQEHYIWEQEYSYKANMINQETPSLSGGIGEIFADDSFSEYALRSGFFRFNYNYKERYLLEVNGRYDGSSKFPTATRFGFFPSVSAGWRISQENFMKKQRVFSDLKLRASYGSIGNQNIDPYKWLPGMEVGKANWYVNGDYVYTLGVPSLVSGNFTWEKVNTLDFGLDAAFLNNRLTFNFDWYKRDTNGMLAAGSEKPGVLGAPAPLENVANLSTNGWELAVAYRGNIGNDFTYNIGASLYDSRTKITKYDNEVGLLSEYRNGQYIGEIWGYTTDRFYTVDDFNADGTLKPGIPYVEGYAAPNPGDILYVNYDDNIMINKGSNTLEDSGDLKIIGNNSPRYQYGITGGINWKGIGFSFVLEGVGKRDMWISNELFWPWADEYSTLMASQLDYWTPDNTDAFFPRIYDRAKKNTKANQLCQTKYLQNGAYLSIRNITLSYTLPKSILEKVKIANASVYLSGENLYTFHHLRQGMHPEARSTQRGWTYPYMSKYSFGVKIGF